MPTTPPNLTNPPPAPSRGSANFAVVADTFLAWLVTFAAQLVAIIANVYTNAVDAYNNATSAAASAATSAASANYVGPWSGLSGALAIPASVSHAGRLWVLASNVANVAVEVPGVSSAWIANYPIQRLALFAATTLTKVSNSSGELVQNAIASTGLAATYVVSNGAIFVAVAGATSGTTVASSTDGRTWTLRTMPTTGTWQVVSDGTNFTAFRQSATAAGTAVVAVSSDGITWTGNSFGGEGMGATLAMRSAGGSGKVITWYGSGGLYSGQLAISTNSGTSFAAGQAPPAGITTMFVAGGNFVGYIGPSGTYYTSSTGLTGSWTTRTLPGSADILVQDFDGALLAYKASSRVLTVWRSTDGVTWSDLGFQLWNAAASIRSINGIYLNGVGSAQFFATRHAQWIPRSASFDVGTTKHAARVGNIHVLIDSNYAHVIDATALDAATGLWD